MGVAGDLLLRADGNPGLNFTLLFLGVAAGIVLLLPRERWSDPEPALLVGAGVFFAASITLRDAIGLNFIAFIAACVAFALVARDGGRGWIGRSGLADMVEALVAAGGRSALGFASFVRPGSAFGSPRSGTQPIRVAEGMGTAAMILRGALMAAPLLLLFGLLLASADPVFERLIQEVVRIDLDPLMEHLVPIGVLGWLATGYFAGFPRGTRIPGLTDRRLPRSTIEVGEANIAVGLVNLLFLSFVLVQVRYLFGGAELVEATIGLTYAEYARSGAVELGLCAGVAIPALLLADWSIRASDDDRVDRVFRSLAAFQIALLLVVLVSAFERLRVYQEVYGLTVSRVYGTVGLVWLGVVAILFVTTVLRGRRDRLAPSGLGSAFVAVAVLIVANPEGVIVRANVDRMEAANTPELDVGYLTELSADAVPALLASLDRLSERERCGVAASLLEKWGPSAASEDWRAWDLATARARRAVAASRTRLAAAVGDGCDS